MKKLIVLVIIMFVISIGISITSLLIVLKMSNNNQIIQIVDNNELKLADENIPLFNSSDVNYDNTESGIQSNNVKGAIDELYACASNYSAYDTRLSNVESNKSDKTATVSTVTWDSTNKKLTKTINGTTSDIVTGENLLANSGVTAGSYGPSANATPGYGSSFNVPYITVDAKGRVTAASTKTVSIPASDKVTVTNSLTSTSTTNALSAAQGKALQGQIDTINNETVYYCTCDTAASTRDKDATCSNFPSSLKAGQKVSVKFTYAQEYNGAARLKINSGTTKNIRRYGTTNPKKNEWKAGEVIDFIYDGTAWIIVGGGIKEDIDTRLSGIKGSWAVTATTTDYETVANIQVPNDRSKVLFLNTIWNNGKPEGLKVGVRSTYGSGEITWVKLFEQDYLDLNTGNMVFIEDSLQEIIIQEKTYSVGTKWGRYIIMYL